MLATMAFTVLDFSALAFFIAAWFGYSIALEVGPLRRRTLNHVMHGWRQSWMEEMARREVRIIDTQIMASLQNGTAFFASTSLLAVGGALTLLRGAEDIVRIFSDLPFGIATSRALWEMKTVGLVVIFVYAFFKFAWSYRIFNYAAILLGATPPFETASSPATQAHVRRVTVMTTAAGRHFNRGQRAFFFALGYLGWFISPIILIVATAGVLFVMARRQLWGDGLIDAVTAGEHPPA
jgi:uncharacterized membrane protein